MADPATRALFQRLLDEGRPEWIVLMALANTVMNHRMRRSREPPMTASRRAVENQAAKEMRREEQRATRRHRSRDPEHSRMQLSLVAATVAQFWGLQINQETPDFDAIEALLKTRYRYWDDDTDHPSYFAALSHAARDESGHREQASASSRPGHLLRASGDR